MKKRRKKKQAPQETPNTTAVQSSEPSPFTIQWKGLKK